ncbi:MAG: hypothetical protein ACREBG_25215 [Pyrinomonadaceae bacterium]
MSTLLQLNSCFTDTLEPLSNLTDEEHARLYSEISHLQSRVTVLADSIRDDALRLAVGKVLSDLVFLLDYLDLVKARPRTAGTIKEVLSLLNAIRGEAAALVFFIENHALQLQGLDEPLNEILDSTAYAIKHEVRRIFDGELAQLELGQTHQEVHGALDYAQGVLTNCFQQCMINLARMFDDSLTEARLFKDWQIRRERSLILCRDLTALIQLVKASEIELLDSLPDQLSSFREGSMQCLMHKDWREYEILSDRVISAIRNGEKASDLVHQLRCYLETLLGHVKARAVLSDLSFESFFHEEVGVS